MGEGASEGQPRGERGPRRAGGRAWRQGRGGARRRVLRHEACSALWPPALLVGQQPRCGPLLSQGVRIFLEYLAPGLFLLTQD